jgi:transposase
MRLCTCCAVGAPGACCPMSFPSGKPSITTFAGGRGKESGIASCTPCACGCASSKAEILSRVQPSSTVNQSKRAPCVVPKRATIRGKKVWGRKRHALVDTQGNLLAVKVTGAEKSDHQGGRALLTPLKKLFPRLKLVWGDSHYGGTFLVWVKEQLGWSIQTIHALTVPKRGLLVPEGEEVDWETLFPTGFRTQPKRWIIERCFSWMVRWRRLCRDHEGLPQSSEAFIKLSASYRMLTTLVPAFPS